MWGYVASQFSYLSRNIGYEPGNILSHRLPIYSVDNRPKDLINARSVHESFFHEVKKPYVERSVSMKITQRDPIKDPNVYTIKRKSLLANKSQDYYNDNQSNVICGPTSLNCLKRSESFLGDMMTYNCYSYHTMYEEPIRTVVLDMDAPQITLFDLARSVFIHSPPSTIHECKCIGKCIINIKKNNITFANCKSYY